MRENPLTRLKEYNNTECFQLLLELLRHDIEHLREKNDSVSLEEVAKNQGAIQWLKKRLKELEPADAPRVYDGGFGD